MFKFKDFKLEREELILRNNIKKVIILREDPYKKLALIMLKFAGLKTEEGFSIEELSQTFGLIDNLSEEIIRDLCEGKFLINNPTLSSSYILTEKGKEAIKNGIVSWKEIRDDTYHFCKFPLYFIPNYLIPFETIIKNDEMKIEPFFRKIFESNLNSHTIFGLPDCVSGISEDGSEEIVCLKNKKIRTILYPIYPENNQRVFNVKLKSYPFYWKETLNNAHPDVNDLLKDFENFEPESALESSLFDILKIEKNNLKIKIEWDTQFEKWILKIIEINTDIIDYFIDKIGELNYNFDFFLESPEQQVIINFKDRKERVWDFKIKIQIKLTEKVIKEFFLKYLSMRIIKDLKKINDLQDFIKNLHKRFCENLDIDFPIHNKNEIKDYLWSKQNYEAVYLLMYEDDFKNE